MNVPRLILCLLALTAFSQAQTPSKPSNIASEWIQSQESQYRTQLRLRQEPVMRAYLAQLKAKAAAAPATEAALWQAEIDRVEKLLAGGGVMDFTAVKPEPQGKASGIMFSLDPDEATPAQPKDGSVPIGSASWTLSSLPAGSYDLIAHFTCVSPPSKATVNITFNGETIHRELRTADLAGKDGEVKVRRLGQIKLKEDVTKQRFVVTSPSSPAWLMIKKIEIMRAAPKPAAP